MYTKVAIDTWNRKEHYTVFKAYAQCSFSMTRELDITNLLKFTKENSYKFYPVIIHTIAQVVNQYPEFRMAIKEDELIQWDYANPSYTVFHKETETFSSLWSSYSDNLEQFTTNFTKDIATHGENTAYFPQGDLIENIFYISAIPWSGFSSFNLQLASINNAFTPMFTLGKYEEVKGKVTLPLAIQVHHAVCDGFHVARFYNTLQDKLNAF